ncbi:hypothetical protein NEIG_00876 [Nematocida sp. ERTm5]|nr:hypothetical protein NEIG_00876 [Nematocida sp. ERTm5]
MQISVHNECCLRILSTLNILKCTPLQKIELENILSELNRLITIATTKQEIPEVKIERVNERNYIINNTHIRDQDGRIEIEKTDILLLQPHFTENPIGTIEDAVDYVKILYENRICIACLRKASTLTLAMPLIVRKVNGRVFVYHTECIEDGEESNIYLVT